MQIVNYMVDTPAGLCGEVWRPVFSPVMWHEPSWTKGEQLVEVRTSLCHGRALPPLHPYSGAYTHTHTHTHTGFIGALPIANSFPSINWKRYQFEWTVFLSGCWLVFLCWWNCCIYPSVGCLAFLLLPSW